MSSSQNQPSANWWKRSFRVRLIATVGLAATLIIAGHQVLDMFGLPFLGVEGRLQSLRNEAYRKLSLAADMKKTRLGEVFDEFKRDIRIYASDESVKAAVTDLLANVKRNGLLDQRPGASWEKLSSDSSFRTIDRHFDRIHREYASYDTTHVVDAASGRIVYTSTYSLLGTDLSQEHYFQAARQGAVYVSNASQSLADRASVSRVCAPVLDSTGRPVAIVILVINMDNVIQPLLRTGSELGQSGDVVLINEKATILTSLKYPLADGSTAKPLEYQIRALPAQRAASGQEGLAETEDYRNVPVLAAYRHIRLSSDWGWGLVVKMDRDELLSAIDTDVKVTVFFSLIAVLLLIVLLSLLMRRITAPIEAVARVAGRLATGDRTVRTGIRQADEIGQLASAFDAMADTIESNLHALESRNLDLQRTTSALAARQRIQSGALNISRTISESASLEELLKETLPALLEALNAQAGAVYLTEPDIPNRLRLAHCVGISRREALREQIALGEGQIGLAAQQRKTQILQEIPKDTEFTILSLAGEALPERIISIPLLLQEKLLGVLSFTCQHAPGQEAWDVLDACTGHLATGLANALAHERTARLARELRSANEELTAVNEELKAQSEELREQADEMREQSEELRQTATALDAQRLRVMEADRLKSEFLSNMSHELRTPLNSILALSQLMQSRGPGKSPQTDLEHLAIIERNGRNLLRLINDILDLSKIEAGRMDLNVEDIDLSSIVQSVVATTRPLAEAKKLDFQVQTTKAGTLQGDAERIRQILLNLLSNAVKFTDQGHVTLSMKGDDSSVCFAVQDTGIGIPEDQLPHIFDEFRQVDGSTSRHHEGTGLGLAICRRLASLMGGQIQVESRMGKGSTFTLVLPRQFAPGPAPQTTADVNALAPTRERAGVLIPPKQPYREGGSNANAGRGGASQELRSLPERGLIMPARRKVLIVDDDPQARRQVARCLLELGYAAEEAASGTDALRMVHQDRPYAITLDILMPGMDGWEVLRQLKGHSETATIPVIIISVSDDHVTGAALGAVGHVGKPVDREQLRAALREFSRRSPVRSVLIVDDNPMDREQIQLFLQDDRYVVHAVPDGAKALHICREYPPDAVILDLVMPDLDGFEVLQRLRSWPETRDLPVVVVTAKDLTADDRKRLSALAQKNLFKSDNGARLRRELKEALDSLALSSLPVNEQPSILVVEDNEIAALQIRTALEENGFRVTIAPGGEEALAEVSRHLPDGIVLDLMMPKVDGFAVLESIRATPWAQAVPVLVLTAKELTPEDRKHLKHNHIKDLIQKGAVDRAQLIEAVSTMVRTLPPTWGSPLTGSGPRASSSGADVSECERGERGPTSGQWAAPPSPGIRASRSCPPSPTAGGGQSDGQTAVGRTAPTQILVIEDHPDNQTAIRASLESVGLSCHMAGNADAALRAVRADRPALILMDVQLPGMSGLELARRLKADPATQHIPIVALTAKAMKGDREAILAAGCDDYISKPFDPPALLEVVRKWMGQLPLPCGEGPDGLPSPPRGGGPT